MSTSKRTEKALDTLQKRFSSQLQENKSIAPYLTLRNSATASYFIEAKSREDLIDALSISFYQKIPYLLIGGGSNIALTQEVFQGLVIRNMYQKKEVLKESETDVLLQVSSGYSMTRLAVETAKEGFSGLEYHAGLPGSVGGATVMNSKWTNPKAYVGDVVEEVVLLQKDGTIQTVPASYCEFAYGYSKLQETGEILLEVVFRLQKTDAAELIAHTKTALEYRTKTQPKGKPTSGCFFKNISEADQIKHNLPTRSAGYLIDKAGCKNLKVGDYIVSDLHANFILNTGSGSAQDLKSIVAQVKEKVRDTFQIELREEVLVL